MASSSPNCASCKAKFNTNNLRISCEKCSEVYHKKCVKASTADWNKFMSGDYLFNCDKCKSKRRSSILGNASMASVKNSDATLNASNTSANGVKSDLSNLKHELESFKNITKDVEESLTNLHDTISSLESKIDLIMTRVKDIDSVMAENTRLRNSIDQLEKRVVSLEMKKPATVKPIKKNKKNVNPPSSFIATVSGIEAAENEVDSKVNELFSQLDLNYQDAVEKCVRSSSKDKSKTVIFVSLKSHDHLRELVKAAKSNRPKNVFVNERLTPTCYKLLKEAKSLLKFGFKHVWSSNGRVLARKMDAGNISLIKTFRDIEALRAEFDPNENDN